MEKVIIRKARLEEYDEILPRLATKSYQDRFFNDKTIKENSRRILEIEKLELSKNTSEDEFLEYGGSLSIPFTSLRPQLNGSGQSFESFRRYWIEKKSDKNFKVYVAELSGKIIGFVKGNFEYVDFSKDFPDVSITEREKIISLGSLYVDPDSRRGGVGTDLVRYYIKEAIKEKQECNGFITECYWRNNSQYFFNKLGASSIGFCNIPDVYLDDKLERKIQNIVGEVMFWGKKEIDRLLNTPIIKSGEILSDTTYTRNTSEYSIMTIAKGDIDNFRSIKSQNLSYWTSRISKRLEKTNNEDLLWI